MIATEDAKNDKDLGPLLDGSVGLLSWQASGKLIIAYPVDFGKQLNVVCSHPQELTDVADGDGHTNDRTSPTWLRTLAPY